MARIVVSDTLNVTLFDTGDSVLISGTDRENVALVLKQLANLGATIVRSPQETGSNWTASCRRPPLAEDEVQVEKLGYRYFVRGRTLEGVRAKVKELSRQGAGQETSVNKIDDVYIAICHDATGTDDADL